MTITRRTFFNADENEVPPGKVKFFAGTLLLAAGTADEAVAIFGLSQTSVPFAFYSDNATFVPANAGFLTPVYNPVTGIVGVRSSNVADNNRVSWVIFD